MSDLDQIFTEIISQQRRMDYVYSELAVIRQQNNAILARLGHPTAGIKDVFDRELNREPTQEQETQTRNPPG